VPPRVVLVPPPTFPVFNIVTPLDVEKHQMFPEMGVKTACPQNIYVATFTPANKNPFECAVLLVLPVHVQPLYPVVKAEPDPICTIGILVPFVLTPLNITVILFTQLGIPVKSIEVPDVLATAVPLVITELAIVVITAPDMLGEVPSTTAPVPVLVVTPVPPLNTGRATVKVVAPVTTKLLLNVALFDVSTVRNSVPFCWIPEFNTPALSVIVIFCSPF